MRPPPPVNWWPPGAGTTRAPPCSHRGATTGPREGQGGDLPLNPSPLSPPDPRTAGGRPGGRRPCTPPTGPGGRPAPREGRDTQGGAPLPRYTLLSTACLQSAARPFPQYPQQADSPAPALKGTPWAAPGWRHADVSQCSVEGGAMTKRPALVLARGGRRDGPQQSNVPTSHPARPPSRAPEESRPTDHPPPPPGQTDPPAAGQTAPGAGAAT